MTDPAATVHIIDDDEAVRDALGHLLRRRGLQTCLHASAQAFLDRPPPGPSSCILTDAQMPAMGGLDLLRRLKAMGACLPMVIMSGRTDRGVAVEAAALGAIFIEKPFTPEEILGVILAALGRSFDDR